MCQIWYNQIKQSVFVQITETRTNCVTVRKTEILVHGLRSGFKGDVCKSGVATLVLPQKIGVQPVVADIHIRIAVCVVIGNAHATTVKRSGRIHAH